MYIAKVYILMYHLNSYVPERVGGSARFLGISPGRRTILSGGHVSCFTEDEQLNKFIRDSWFNHE